MIPMRWGGYLLEGVRALALLAVVFLNFAHAPLASATERAFAGVVAAASYCGVPSGDDRAGHAPCHACRIGGAADLPGRIDFGVAAFAAATVDYAWPIRSAPVTPDARKPPARGPPHLT